jgi:hypothetical protein
MFLSAAVFGFFGFTFSWNHIGVNNQFLLFVALLEWTLKGSCLVFALSGALALVKPAAGNLLYAFGGLAGAAMFLVVAVMDWLDSQHTALHPVVLLLFAAWNGYGSWTGLRAVLARPGSG